MLLLHSRTAVGSSRRASGPPQRGRDGSRTHAAPRCECMRVDDDNVLRGFSMFSTENFRPHMWDRFLGCGVPFASVHHQETGCR